ncbi:SUN domain-containing protein [Aphelenchoides besseyi]|nr:SUN domain-containing protein [Aphelenchoides besseyi]
MTSRTIRLLFYDLIMTRILLLLFISLAKNSRVYADPTSSTVLQRYDHLFLSPPAQTTRTSSDCFPFISTPTEDDDRATEIVDGDDRFSSTRRSHDLNNCPVNAADTLNDLHAVDPAAPTNLSSLRNRTDVPINHTTETIIKDAKSCNNSGESFASTETATQIDGEVRSEKVDGELPTTESAEKPIPEKGTIEIPPPIATFEEWTKEKLMNKEKRPPVKEQNVGGTMTEQQGASNGAGTVNLNANGNSEQNGVQTQSNGHSTPQATQPPLTADKQPLIERPSVPPTTEFPKRNYASRECGAKVLLANEEAEHRNAVLNDKERDEYMRNPCEKAQNKFLVIELCETIQPTLLELANFELFSSGPRDFRLSVSERYPTHEWIPVGQFVAEDTREGQTFSFASPGIYTKFIKLELLSHYGREHYCTLSTIRVSGISMVDEMEAEASSLENPQSNVIQPEVVLPPSTTLEKTQTLTTQPTVQTEIPDVTTQLQPPSTQQAVDPTNESKTSNGGKTHVLNKVVNIVENLSNIKEVFGKTFLGSRHWKQTNALIHQSSCLHHSPLDFDMATRKSSWRCHVFRVLDFSAGSRRSVLSTSWTSTDIKSAPKSNGQLIFLLAIEKLHQCPTAVAAPKVVEIEEPKPIVQSTETLVPESSHVVPEKKIEEPKQQQTTQTVSQQANSQYTPPKTPSINSLPGTASTHKESVFMKLNKRLSALELNMSLSSEYLSELSRRYVAQQTDYNKQHERDVKTLEQMVNKLGEHLKSAWSEEIREMKREINDLARQMQFIKEASHLPPHYQSASTSSVSLFGSFDPRSCVKCYNMLPPAKDEDEEDEYHDSPNTNETSLWSNEQIVAIIFLSNLSAFTLFTCVYLLYKVFTRRSVVQEKMKRETLTSEEIRELVEQEMERLKSTSPVQSNGHSTTGLNGSCIRLPNNSICAFS